MPVLPRATSMHFHASLFRQIQVRIPDDGYQLSYRRGYDADQPLPESASEEATEDPLMPLIGLGMPNAAKEKRPGFLFRGVERRPP
jgi:hypothetical protein